MSTTTDGTFIYFPEQPRRPRPVAQQPVAVMPVGNTAITYDNLNDYAVALQEQARTYVPFEPEIIQQPTYSTPTYANAGALALGALGAESAGALPALGPWAIPAALLGAGAYYAYDNWDKIKPTLGIIGDAMVRPWQEMVRNWGTTPTSVIDPAYAESLLTPEDRRQMQFNRLLAENAPGLYRALNPSIAYDEEQEGDPIPRVDEDGYVLGRPMTPKDVKRKIKQGQKQGLTNIVVNSDGTITGTGPDGRKYKYDPDNDPNKKPWYKNPWVIGGLVADDILGNALTQSDENANKSASRTIANVISWIPGIGWAPRIARAAHWWPYNDTNEQQQFVDPGNPNQTPMTSEDSVQRILDGMGGGDNYPVTSTHNPYPTTQPTGQPSNSENEEYQNSNDTVSVNFMNYNGNN